MKDTYVCKCGKTFTQAQSFAGHKSSCAVYHQYLADQAQQWINAQHRCEHCGIIMTEKFGSGRFCSRKCSNSRVQTEEINNKRRSTLIANHPEILVNRQLQEQQCLQEQAHIQRTKYLRKNSKKFLLNTYESYIDEHNRKIEEMYESLLSKLAVGKDEYFPPATLIFAKY